ncbi:MAG: DUF3299 domain-containing protein [Burkholderiales bacterium]
MMQKIANALLLIGIAFTSAARADDARQMMWADLVPKSAAGENPFEKLNRDQLQQISDISAIRERRARGDPTLLRADDERESELAKKLQLTGVVVDELLARRRDIIERGRAVNPLLNGQTIRIPGYVLPLEFSGKQVSEFLLVPWVGACIHTPPPPPNQIVHVKPGKPVTISGMFEAVWVTGRLNTQSLTKNLSMVDGAAEIDVGYSLTAAVVEPYKQ